MRSVMGCNLVVVLGSELSVNQMSFGYPLFPERKMKKKKNLSELG